MRPDSRGVSPVVGTVIIVGVAVALAAAGAYVLLSIGDRTGAAPRVVFDLEESDERGMYVLTHKSGSRVDGDNLTLRGTANPDSPAGQSVAATDELSFYPVARTVRVVWHDEHDTAYTLATVRVDDPLPTPEESCDWVDEQSDGGTDPVTVDGIVVNCDVESDEQVTVRNGGTVIGDIDSNLKDFDGDDATVYGTVDADAVVNLQNGTITGDAVSQTADIKIDEGEIDGSVEAQRVAEVTSGTVVQGDLESEAKDVKILSGSTVEGSVTAGEIVKLQDGTVKGHVYIDPGDFDCTDATVDGQDCGSYTPRDPADWPG